MKLICFFKGHLWGEWENLDYLFSGASGGGIGGGENIGFFETVIVCEVRFCSRCGTADGSRMPKIGVS